LKTDKQKSKKEFLFAISIMLGASLSVILILLIWQNLIAVFLVYYVGFCLFVPAFDIIFLKKKSFHEFLTYLGFTVDDLKTCLFIGFLHGVLLYFLIVGGYFLFQDVFSFESVFPVLKKWGISADGKGLIFAIMILFNGLLEEMFWRGYLLRKVKTTLSTGMTIFLVSLFYTSYHCATIFAFFHFSFLSFVSIIGIFVLGFFWGFIRLFSNSIWISMLGHTLVTFAYMTIFLLL